MIDLVITVILLASFCVTLVVAGDKHQHVLPNYCRFCFSFWVSLAVIYPIYHFMGLDQMVLYAPLFVPGFFYFMYVK